MYTLICPWAPSATCKWGDACADCDKHPNFKVSDTPPSGPEKNSGHPGTPGPPNNKEIA